MDAAQSYNHLNPLQLEMLQLFSRKVDNDDLLEIKRLIVKYFGDKAIKQADEVWENGKWDNEKIDELRHLHDRTPYNNDNQ